MLLAFNANACRAYGRGIQPTGLRMREKAEFHVTTENAGEAELAVAVKGPSKHLFFYRDTYKLINLANPWDLYF